MYQSELAKKGYIHLEGKLPQVQITEVLRDAKRVFAIQMEQIGIDVGDMNDEVHFSNSMFEFFKKDQPRFISAAKLCQNLISLHRLSLSDEVFDAVRGAGLEFPTISTRPTMFFNAEGLATSQGYWKTPPHQDWRSMQGSLNAVVIWVPLLDIPVELGALEVVPGSHRHGLMESTEDDFYRRIESEHYNDNAFHPIVSKAGDCLLFSAFLVHRSGTNSTNRVRWSCHFRYNDACEETFIDRQFPNPYLYKPQQDLLTPDFPSHDQLSNLFLEKPQ